MSDVKKLSENNGIRGKISAHQLKLIFIQVAYLDINYLKKARKELKNQFSKYEAIGIIDGAKYIEKSDSMEAKLNRLNAVINLYDVLHKTNSKIIQGNEMDSIKEFFNQ